MSSCAVHHIPAGRSSQRVLRRLNPITDSEEVWLVHRQASSARSLRQQIAARREMPRDKPPPLKISRASDPHHHHHHHQRPFRAAAAVRQPPVIIHTYSPEVIHIESDRFRQLVQRLTGPGSHTPPPPKRARLAVAPFRPALSPRGLRQPSQAGEAGLLLPSRLLSPLLFDFSPSILPSPPAFPFDLPSLASPMGTRPPPSSPGGLLWRSPATPRSLAAALPSPGPISARFLAELPVLSPTTYSFIERNAYSPPQALPAPYSFTERNAGSPEALPTPRFRLPPRPTPTTTANLFPQTSAPRLAAADRHRRDDDERKPSHLYLREK